MADIEAPAQAPPPRRRAVTALAALCMFLAHALHAALYGLLGALWMSAAASAARIAARWAYGEGYSAAATAGEVFYAVFASMGLIFVVFCSVLVVLVLHIAVLAWLVLPRHGSRKGEAREISEDGCAMMPAAEGCDLQSSGARGRPDGVYGPVTKPSIIVLFVVMAVGLLMVVLAPANGSCEERVGSMLVDIGSFLTSLMICFVIFPNNAI